VLRMSGTGNAAAPRRTSGRDFSRCLLIGFCVSASAVGDPVASAVFFILVLVDAN
jgi:hypothetical protein